MTEHTEKNNEDEDDFDARLAEIIRKNSSYGDFITTTNPTPNPAQTQNVVRVVGNNGTLIPNKKNTSGFKGVSWNRGHKKWQARIHVEGKRKFLGYYNTALEASVAYQFELSQKQNLRKSVEDGKGIIVIGKGEEEDISQIRTILGLQ